MTFFIPKVGLLQGTLPHAQPKPAHGAVGAAGHDLPQELAFGTEKFSLSPAKRIVTYITCYIDLYSNLPILYLPYLNISLILASWNIKTTTSPRLAGRLAILNSSMLLSPDLRIKRAILKPKKPNPWDWKWSRFNFHAPGQDLGRKIVGRQSFKASRVVGSSLSHSDNLFHPCS